MPFCRECGELVEVTWKFCSHCNSSQQSAVTVQDGVIAGDVTVAENITNITNEETKCPQCRASGNITLHPCSGSSVYPSPKCTRKICNLCRAKIDCKWNRGRCLNCVSAYRDGLEKLLRQEKREEERRKEELKLAGDPYWDLTEREREEKMRKSAYWRKFQAGMDKFMIRIFLPVSAILIICVILFQIIYIRLF